MNSSFSCVVVLGMHRSGTSCLSGTLNQYGLFFGSISQENPFNIKGNYENHEVMLLNNELLKKNNGSWIEPPSSIKWTNRQKIKQAYIIEDYIKHGVSFGIKDPRFLLTFSFWENAYHNMKYIGIFRHPFDVARSLNFRNNIQIDQGLRLWYLYNSKLIMLVTKKKFPILFFNVTKDEFHNSVEETLNYLNIPYSNVVTTFYEEKLIHYKVNNNTDSFPDNIPDYIMNLYENLKRIYKSQLYIS